MTRQGALQVGYLPGILAHPVCSPSISHGQRRLSGREGQEPAGHHQHAGQRECQGAWAGPDSIHRTGWPGFKSCRCHFLQARRLVVTNVCLSALLSTFPRWNVLSVKMWILSSSAYLSVCLSVYPLIHPSFIPPSIYLPIITSTWHTCHTCHTSLSPFPASLQWG